MKSCGGLPGWTRAETRRLFREMRDHITRSATHEPGHSSSSSFSSSTTHPVWTFSRTRRTTRTRTNQFMVPMRVRKQMEAFHEPHRRAGILPASVGNTNETEPLALAHSPGRLEACPTFRLLRLMVPMHAQKPKEPLPARLRAFADQSVFGWRNSGSR